MKLLRAFFLCTALIISYAAGAERGLGNTPQTEASLLEKARLANQDLYSSLQSFVCQERIDRYQGTIGGEFGKVIDTVTTKLSFENGVEHYSDIRQNNHARTSLSRLPGAWSEGEFGTLLLQTEKLLATQTVAFQAFADLDGVTTAVYRFTVSDNDSPWDLEVAGQHYRLPFRTDVWISTSSGEILKIDRTSTDFAPETHISEIRWSVTLHSVDLNGKQWLLPKSGSYAVLYEESRRREWNVMNFSDYHRYGSEVALRFN